MCVPCSRAPAPSEVVAPHRLLMYITPTKTFPKQSPSSSFSSFLQSARPRGTVLMSAFNTHTHTHTLYRIYIIHSCQGVGRTGVSEREVYGLEKTRQAVQPLGRHGAHQGLHGPDEQGGGGGRPHSLPSGWSPTEFPHYHGQPYLYHLVQ